MDLKRGVDPAMLAALDVVFYPVLFAFLDWPLAPVRAHTGVGTITWGGHDWTGVGRLGGLSVPPEAMGGVVASEAVVSLVGVPADLDGLADDVIRGRMVEVYLGVVGDRPGGYNGAQAQGASATLVGVPVSIFAGTMDQLNIDSVADRDGVDHSAQVAVVTGPSARSMSSIAHSNEDQTRKHPGDTAGRLLIMAFAKAQKLLWPED